MDSKVLSKEQLTLLVKFIHSRGFKGSVLVLEILDHFACKVEEILAQHPDIPFETVMKRAHESFGVRGFYPIAESVLQQTRSKYKRLFWTNFKDILKQPVSFISLPVIGYTTYSLYVWLSLHTSFKIWDYWNIVDVAFFILLLLAPLLDLTIMFNLPKRDRKHPFITASLMNGSVSGLTLNIILSGIMREKNVEYPWVVGAILAIYIVYIIPRHIATKRTIAKAKDDLEAVRQMAIE